MVPYTIATRASLPRNPNGKFDHIALRADAANLVETL